ncbi:GT4 family glycosyltransferase PelF [Edaphobacter sp. 12200R-103]|uniref:GT4 family glycosyltransferase PelF n=1 Tax=Edaphobacter sp. 12200R-103 TaxID=2703788 RepID=UPI00138D31FB|nr:GT4 family glycosyltransferase PelF [Edaphobacter sp. 12200R-103]QHS52236.1 glycosyltransferase [Edaphobacter sp. 12200R-103]
MKIIHVVYSLEMGGAEILVAQLCRLQREHGHDVSVIAYSNLGTLGEQLVAEGFSVLVLGEAAFAKTFLRFIKAFRRLRPNVVHCHNPAPTLQAAIPARLTGTRSVLSTRHSLVAPPYNPSEERAFNFVTRFCNWVVGICDATCENLKRIPGAHRDKIVRIYNGVDPVPPTPAESCPAKSGFTLLFVGRLAPIKDLSTLIRAVAIAVQRVPDLHLWVVGHGAERDHLDSLVSELGIRENVTFWGERLDVAGFFRTADLYCMSSVSEGLPMSLLQAMSVGVPAIVTDVGGMAEVVKNSNAGLATPVGDPEAMAGAILQLASDPDRRHALAENAREAYQQNFTLERMDASYIELYSRPS